MLSTSRVCGRSFAMTLRATKNTGQTISQRQIHYKRALMCSPDHFYVGDLINPWMGGVVDKAKAYQQWNDLRIALEQAGVEVSVIPQDDCLPDMVFACNSGIARGNKVYLSHFRHESRQPERDEYRKWFEENGFKIYGGDRYDFFEGGGDAFFMNDDLLCAGYGYRTEKKVYDHVSEIGSFKTVLCELVDPKFYHLDTCLFPLNESEAVYYPDAFSADTRETLHKYLKLIPVSAEEATKFGCNALPVPHSKTVICPSGCDHLEKELTSLGYKVVSVDMSEFMKSGGACQCLVMKLPD